MKKVILYTSISIIILLTFSIVGFIVYFNTMTKDIELDLDKLERTHISLVLDNENLPINDDSYVEYNDIPPMLINAFVSIEDKRYFEHNGIDVRRMIGATWYNITHGKRAQGASTITQQLIKNTHLTSKKTIERKLKEVKLALKLEKELSKEEIIERYLNSIYFGNGIYGIKDASKRIFNKELDNLNISECATIAGIVKAPTYYSPLNDLPNSITRRDIVLKTMLDNGYIDDSDYNNAKSIEIVINNDIIHNSYSDIYLKQALYEASKILGIPLKEIINGNYTISTYYDKNVSKSLYDAVISNKDIIGNNNITSIIADNENSSISALYTTIDDDIMSFRRQVGSVIKPIAVYLPALDMGMINPATVYNDEPITIDGYKPSNYNDHYGGNISIRKATMCSSNIVPVKILDEITIDKSKEYLNKMGINITDNGLSIALGGLKDGLTANEILDAYLTIANRGIYSESSLIRSITDKNGVIIYRRNANHTKVTDESSAFIMTDILRDTAKYGTARKLGHLPFDIASKTGTVAHPNDENINIDAYNLSFTSENTILTWFGGEMDRNIQGGAHPTILTRCIYENLYKESTPNEFIMPSSVQKLYFDMAAYDNDNKILLTDDTYNSYSEIFDDRYLPKDHVISPHEIEISYENDVLSIKNVPNATIKIYNTALFGATTLIKEIYLTQNNESIPIKDSIFDNYHIDIYSGEKLIKSIDL